MSIEGRRRPIGACLLLLASSTAAAAWQPPKAQPAQKAESCSEMGEGFIRIAGSGTCIRVGGSVRVEAARSGGGAAFVPANH